MHSWVALICIMRCCFLVFQRCPTFYLQSCTTQLISTELNCGQIAFRNILFRTLPQTVLSLFPFLFLADRTHLVYLIVLVIWLPTFKNGFALWLELAKRADMKQRFIFSLKYWELEFSISKTVKRQREKLTGHLSSFPVY